MCICHYETILQHDNYTSGYDLVIQPNKMIGPNHRVNVGYASKICYKKQKDIAHQNCNIQQNGQSLENCIQT